MDYLDEIDPLAKQIGAVNTVVHKDGKLIGYNTDGIGFVRALQSISSEPLQENVFYYLAQAVLVELFIFHLLMQG